MAKDSERTTFSDMKYPAFADIGPGDYIYHYFGRVIPERMSLSLPIYHAATGGVSGEDQQVEGIITVNIAASQVSVTCRFKQPISDFSSLRHTVEDMVLTQIDAVSLLLTQPFLLQLDTFVNASHEVTVLDAEPARLIGVEERIGLQDIRNANNYYAGLFLREALRDYSEALSSPRRTAFFCYRAIEALRQFFEQFLAIEDRDLAWSIFRRHIPIKEEDARRVAKLAEGERHGEPAAIQGDTRFFCIQIACAAIVYYVELISSSHHEGLNPNRPI